MFEMLNQRLFMIGVLFLINTFPVAYSQNIYQTARDFWQRHEASDTTCLQLIFKIKDNSEVFLDESIDTYMLGQKGLHLIFFKTLEPHAYAHYILSYNGMFVILNMRKPLDKLIDEAFDFLGHNKIQDVDTSFWTDIIQLHYGNRYVDIWDRPRFWSYEPLESTIKPRINVLSPNQVE